MEPSFWPDFIQYIFMGIQRGCIYALVAMGYNIIYNSTGVINFAQGEFVVYGGLMMVTLTMSLGMPVLPAFFLAVIFAMIVGILMERLTINPVKNPTGLQLIIITIAVSIIMKGLAMCFWGKGSHYMKHFSGDEPLKVLGALLLPQTLWIMAILTIIVILQGFFFKYTMTGKSMRACSINRDSAKLAGINDRFMVMLSFALSAGAGAVAGIIITPIIQMDYGRGAILGLKGFGAAVAGGLGSSFGGVLAGLLLGILEAMGGGYISSHYMDAMALVILIMVLFIKPSGLMGGAGAKGTREI